MTITEWGPLGPALSLIAVAGVIGSYLMLRHEMRSEIAKLRERLAPQLPSEQNVAAPPAQPVPKATTAPPPKKAKQEVPPVPAKEEITPEILAVIAAAVAQFVGAGSRIRSTRLLSTAGGMNPWAQQGRVIIQASHNLGVR